MPVSPNSPAKPHRRRPLLSAALALALLAPAAGALTGCSVDRHTFNSYSYRPTTVEIVEPHSQKTVWAMDIPVGYKLMINFDGNENDFTGSFSQDAQPAKKMTWEIRPLREYSPTPNFAISNPLDKGEVKLSGEPIITKVSYRDPQPETEPIQ